MRRTGAGASPKNTFHDYRRLIPLASRWNGPLQHPEVISPREITDELIRMMKEWNVTGSMLVSNTTGDGWARHPKSRKDVQKHLAEAAKKTVLPVVDLTTSQTRKRERDPGADPAGSMQ